MLRMEKRRRGEGALAGQWRRRMGSYTLSRERERKRAVGLVYEEERERERGRGRGGESESASVLECQGIGKLSAKARERERQRLDNGTPFGLSVKLGLEGSQRATVARLQPSFFREAADKSLAHNQHAFLPMRTSTWETRPASVEDTQAAEQSNRKEELQR